VPLAHNAFKSALREGRRLEAAARADWAFEIRRQMGAPRGGDFVRLLWQGFRCAKTDLGRLASSDFGHTLFEALGEDQEMIDVYDLAVRLSRHLRGSSARHIHLSTGEALS
jgi:aldehyde dehydrogenase (NAD+)